MHSTTAPHTNVLLTGIHLLLVSYTHTIVLLSFYATTPRSKLFWQVNNHTLYQHRQYFFVTV